MGIITKVCTKCGKPKPLDDFWNHPTGKYGKRPRCKECVGSENYEHLQNRLAIEPSYNRDRVKVWSQKGDNKRRRNLLGRYGITLEEYDALFAEQDEKCAVCGDGFEDSERRALDHDHESGKVRGILHYRCNMAIGVFKDSPELCRKAAEYLEKHGKV